MSDCLGLSRIVLLVAILSLGLTACGSEGGAVEESVIQNRSVQSGPLPLRERQTQAEQGDRGALGLAGKTLWDWMEVLGTPVTVGIIAGLFLLWAQRGRRDARVERELTTDRAREAALQSFLGSMTSLILERELLKSEPGSAARAVARAQTLTVLRGLNGIRKGLVTRFLHESALIAKTSPVISLDLADLSGAELMEAVLEGADLTGANLRGAILFMAGLQGIDLHGADLSGANLAEADLRSADLRGATLIGANLDNADLSNANLSEAIMVAATLREAILIGTNLNRANLARASLSGSDMTGATLTRADLTQADLRDADLSAADLNSAILSSAKVTDQQLRRCNDLEGATMPNGNQLDRQLWENFRNAVLAGTPWWKFWRR